MNTSLYIIIYIYFISKQEELCPWQKEDDSEDSDIDEDATNTGDDGVVVHHIPQTTQLSLDVKLGGVNLFKDF